MLNVQPADQKWVSADKPGGELCTALYVRVYVHYCIVVEASGRIADTIVCRDSFVGPNVSELTRKPRPESILRQFGRCDSERKCRFVCRGSQLRRAPIFFSNFLCLLPRVICLTQAFIVQFFIQFFTFLSLPHCERIVLPPLSPVTQPNNATQYPLLHLLPLHPTYSLLLSPDRQSFHLLRLHLLTLCFFVFNNLRSPLSVFSTNTPFHPTQPHQPSSPPTFRFSYALCSFHADCRFLTATCCALPSCPGLLFFYFTPFTPTNLFDISANMPRANSTRASLPPAKNARPSAANANVYPQASPACDSRDGAAMSPRVTARISRPSRRASAAALSNSGVSTRMRKQSENTPFTSDAVPTPTSTPDPASPTTGSPPATHRRKRRRQPAPLSVTNVLSSSNLPTTCRKLWDWPVFSWFLGDVTPSDFDLTTDQPFHPSNPVTGHSNHDCVAPNSPLPMHYRLRWLVHDAAALIDSSPPPPPTPFFHLISNPLKEASPVCARPSPCLNAVQNTNSGTASSSRKGKRGARRKAVAPTSSRPRKRMRAVDGVPAPENESEALPSENGTPRITPSALLSDNPVAAELRARQCLPFDKAATFAFQNGSATREWRPNVLVRSLANHSPSSLRPEHPYTRPKEEDPLAHSPAPTREPVCLQMVSPSQPAVLANLFYSVPRGSFADDSDVRFEHFDLNFRDMKKDQHLPLDDIDETDELAGDIQELIAKREVARENSRPIRAIAAEALQVAMAEQEEHDALRVREAAIRERLAVIAREKSAAARAEAANTKAKIVKGRRASTRLRGATSRRRGLSNNSDPDTGAASLQISALGEEVENRDGSPKMTHSNDFCVDGGDAGMVSSEGMPLHSTLLGQNDSSFQAGQSKEVTPKKLFRDEMTNGHGVKYGEANGSHSEAKAVAGEQVTEAQIDVGQEKFENVAPRPQIDAENVCLSAIDQVPSPVSPLQAVTRIRELTMKMASKGQ